MHKIINVCNSKQREDKETWKILLVLCTYYLYYANAFNCKYLNIRSYLNVLCDMQYVLITHLSTDK